MARAKCTLAVRLGAFVALGLALLTSTEVAEAQVFVQPDPIGTPIGLFLTPVLTNGACYEIETSNLSANADPVMSIRDGQNDLANTLAGADSCSGNVRPACTRFCPVQSRAYYVWVRSYNVVTRGTADVRIQQMAGPTGGTPGAGICPPGSPVSFGCWTNMVTNLSFGGMIRNEAFPTGQLQFETGEMPGSQTSTGNVSSHIIVFAGENDNTALNWKIASSAHPPLLGSGAPASHRNGVLRTAQYSGLRPSQVPSGATYVAIAGPFGGSGPYRFMRNDFVFDTAERAGVDADLDKIGVNLPPFCGQFDYAARP